MNISVFKTVFILSTFLLAACGENTATETAEKEFLSEAQIQKDSLDFSKIEPLEIPENANVVVAQKEELLAENTEEKSTQKVDKNEFIKTELDEVVLSRKTPPGSNSLEDALGGTGSGNDSGEGMSGSGDGTGTGPANAVTRMERKIIDTPIIAPAGEEAIVSVEVIVNPGGTVMRTKLLLATQKTNTTNIKLHEFALRYAKQYKFEADESLERNTVQVIHIHFSMD